ncbi:hypothetical protein EAG_15455 [Camponotus floridanus]|uniref:Uncharacterized protein n=1 Tax=Camponotus floridanus TaxID=104421 RepID=E2AT83_CAMFO|nr:hypothetical protein EAG_15455 [Camponotus floridanus]
MTWYRHVIDRITVTWSFFYLTAQLEVANNEQRTSHRLLQEAPEKSKTMTSFHNRLTFMAKVNKVSGRVSVMNQTSLNSQKLKCDLFYHYSIIISSGDYIQRTIKERSLVFCDQNYEAAAYSPAAKGHLIVRRLDKVAHSTLTTSLAVVIPPRQRKPDFSQPLLR